MSLCLGVTENDSQRIDLLFEILISSDKRELFFFSSRRRHTRLQGDWSSDVCSSDLSGTARIVDGRCANPPPWSGRPVWYERPMARSRSSSPAGWSTGFWSSRSAPSVGDRKSVV